MDRKSITTAQAAERLGVSAQTVQKWVDAGHLSAWRTVGGHRRVDAQSVEDMLAQRPGGARSLETEAESTSPGLEVLVVDDDDLSALLMRSLLEDLLPQAQITTLSSGFAGLMHIGRRPPAVLITDVNMAGMDGLAMLRQLRAEESTRDMGCVLVTAYGPDALARFGPVPADVPMLRKPVDVRELAEVLRRVGLQPQVTRQS